MGEVDDPCPKCKRWASCNCDNSLMCGPCGGGGYEILECDEDGLCPPIPPYCLECGGTGVVERESSDGGW